MWTAMSPLSLPVWTGERKDGSLRYMQQKWVELAFIAIYEFSFFQFESSSTSDRTV